MECKSVHERVLTGQKTGYIITNYFHLITKSTALLKKDIHNGLMCI